MNSVFKFTIILGALAASALSSQAASINFTNYNLGGVTASWDVFAGGNRLPSWSFSTADAGNSIQGYAGDLALVATVPGYTAGNFMSYSTGPIDSDGSTIPGDRQMFYTLFGAVNWTVSAVAQEAMTTVVLQVQNYAGSAGGVSNMTLNGITATGTTDAALVTTYAWEGLNIAAGDALNVAWSTATAHSVFDGFQLQTGTGAIPEPSALLLVGGSVLGMAFRRKRTQG